MKITSLPSSESLWEVSESLSSMFMEEKGRGTKGQGEGSNIKNTVIAEDEEADGKC